MKIIIFLYLNKNLFNNISVNGEEIKITFFIQHTNTSFKNAA